MCAQNELLGACQSGVMLFLCVECRPSLLARVRRMLLYAVCVVYSRFVRVKFDVRYVPS